MGLRELLRLKPKECFVRIHDVRPFPDTPNDFSPYFAAICDCGWYASCDTEDEAREAAYEHDLNIATDLFRPIG